MLPEAVFTALEFGFDVNVEISLSICQKYSNTGEIQELLPQETGSSEVSSPQLPHCLLLSTV